jgi:hypothetical protein
MSPLIQVDIGYMVHIRLNCIHSYKAFVPLPV